ncbi:MAG: YebC/PmpR family DNA-binding transcriptional regulator [Spirochaetales bacterium]|nr:YebC/PmpR family DNA-binding transcriptional regulator [Spirochaetales bacterium]
MSGHSKWSTIKHKKGAADAKRGKIFTKIIKEITVAAKMGGGDPDSNPTLRTAIIKAKAANMPKDNIERAVKKGSGESGGADYVELVYEGYGPGGVAFMVTTLTDNKNRTASDVKSTLTKGGGSLGTAGCVSYLFNRKGVIVIEGEGIDADELMMTAIEAGADDVEGEDGVFEITTEPNDFEAVLTALQAAGYKESSAEVTLVPETTVSLDNEKTEKTLKLVEKLEDLDDVQTVSTNLEVPDDFDME